MFHYTQNLRTRIFLFQNPLFPLLSPSSCLFLPQHFSTSLFYSLFSSSLSYIPCFVLPYSVCILHTTVGTTVMSSRGNNSWHHKFSTTLIFSCADFRSLMTVSTPSPVLWSLNSSTLLCMWLYVVFLMLNLRHFYNTQSQSAIRGTSYLPCIYSVLWVRIIL